MIINTFPTTICQLLQGNSTSLKNNSLESDFAFGESRYIPSSETYINMSVILDGNELIEFENFFYISSKQGSIPFYANFHFSDYNHSDDIYMFNGGYQSTHLGLGRYKLSFQVQLVQ